MSIGEHRVMTYSCDHPGCQAYGELEFNDEDTARVQLHDDGWVTIDGKDYCPNHVSTEEASPLPGDI